jgi:hypothetical protein
MAGDIVTAARGVGCRSGQVAARAPALPRRPDVRPCSSAIEGGRPKKRAHLTRHYWPPVRGRADAKTLTLKFRCTARVCIIDFTLR